MPGMGFYVLQLTTMLLRPVAFGAFIGLVLAIALYLTTPAYAAFINWQFSHPLMLIPAAFMVVAGLVIGRIAD